MDLRAIDAGGSITRLARNKNDMFYFKSECMEISPDSVTKPHIITDGELDFIIKEAPMKRLCSRRFVKGVAMGQYSGPVFTCDNQTVKVSQDITYINILYALALDSLRLEANNSVYSLRICIPAAEYFDDVTDRIDFMKKNLSGNTTVYFPLLNKEVSFSVPNNSVMITAEGIIAAFRFRKDRDFALNNAIVIDVGYRSTDITLLMRFNPVGKGAASRSIGGINLEANIQSTLERKDIHVTTSTVQEALCTNYVVQSDSLTDITNYIVKAKLTGMQDYIAEAIRLMSLDNLVVTEEDVVRATTHHYIKYGYEVIDITDDVHKAKEILVDRLRDSILSVVNARMLSLGDFTNLLCIGRPFTGNISDKYMLGNMLVERLHSKIKLLVVPDVGTANVMELISL